MKRKHVEKIPKEMTKDWWENDKAKRRVVLCKQLEKNKNNPHIKNKKFKN